MPSEGFGRVVSFFSTNYSIWGWGSIVLFVLLNSYGTFLLKTQLQRVGEWHFGSISTYFFFFLNLLSSYRTWVGLLSICAATCSWIIALAHLELSRAYPVAVGLNLIILIALATIQFHEPLTLAKVLGAFLILSGILCMFHK